MGACCNTDGLIRPEYWRNGNFGFRPYPWGVWQPVIPSLYWQAITPEQQIHDLYCYVENLLDYSNTQTGWIEENRNLITELQNLFDEWQAHGFDDYYRDLVIKWIDEHLDYIFDHVVKQVFFGLTYDPNSIENSGRFCAYIPSGWSDIQFDTGAVYGLFDYGRLILRYNVDGSGVIDNTGRYDDADINVLRAEVERIKRTLYTLLNAGGE